MSLEAVSPGANWTLEKHWTTNWLPSGDSISAHAWTISPDEGSMIANTAAAIVEVSGFVRGTTYVLTDVVTTTGGRIGKRGFTLVCEANQ